MSFDAMAARQWRLVVCPCTKHNLDERLRPSVDYRQCADVAMEQRRPEIASATRFANTSVSSDQGSVKRCVSKLLLSVTRHT